MLSNVRRPRPSTSLPSISMRSSPGVTSAMVNPPSGRERRARPRWTCHRRRTWRRRRCRRRGDAARGSSVMTMRAPVMAIGWPRLQPLPSTFTSSSSMPRILQVDTHIEANASLISHRSTSATPMPGAFERLGDGDGGRQAGALGRDARRRPRPDDRQRLEALASATVAVGDHHRGGGIVDARRVAGRDAEALDLGVQGREAGQLLDRGAPARVLVDGEQRGRAVAPPSPRSGRSPRRSRPVDAGDGPLVRAARPGVHLARGSRPPRPRRSSRR